MRSAGRETRRLIDWKEDERKDRNRNGIDEDLEPPVPDVSAGSQKLAERLAGDEAIAGSAPTPGQDVVDEIGAALGVTYQDNEPLRVGEKEESRDKKRWELDPASSDDYQDRIREDRKR